MTARAVPWNQSRGFTLLEVMVATAILALVVAGVMHVFSSSLAGVGRANLHTEGVLIARNLLEAYLLNPDMEEGSLSGVTENIFQWQITTTARDLAYDPEGGTLAQEGTAPSIDWVEEDSPLVLFEITVDVTWPEAAFPGRVSLTTMSLRVVSEDLLEEAES